jgi:hypothetical protein
VETPIPTAVVAAPLVADLGFLVHRELATAELDATLVVAVRRRPTLRHFDPEIVRLWITNELGRGEPLELSLGTSTPLELPFAWGPIEIEDRYGATNTFVAFGGRMAADRIGSDELVVKFSSPAPIFPGGGHSQPFEAIAAEVGVFLARVMVAIDFRAGIEQRFSAADPLVRYAAFLRDTTARLRASALLRERYGEEARLVFAERDRLRTRDAVAWEAGRSLLEALSLGR